MIEPFLAIAPSVMHETFEDEVVVVNMKSGHYFSLTGAAVRLWSALIAGTTHTQLVGAFAAELPQTTLDAFLGLLAREGLLASFDDDAPAATLEGTSLAGTVEKFTDVEGLLLLDPIHEVDAAGWPHARGAGD